jgi:hypothetical protein
VIAARDSLEAFADQFRTPIDQASVKLDQLRAPFELIDCILATGDAPDTNQCHGIRQFSPK